MGDYTPKCRNKLPIIFDDLMPVNNLTPKIVNRVNDNTEDLKNLYGETEALQEDVEGKADASGTSENLTAGSAEQLLTDKGITEKVPYILRASGGNGADREEDKIVGGTVAWNQLIKNGNFENTNDWVAVNGSLSVSNNVATITPTYQSGQFAQLYGGSQGVAAIPGHKVLTTIDLKSNAWAQTGNAIVVGIAGLWMTNLTASELSTTNWNRLSIIKQLTNTADYVNADARKYYESSMADFQVRNFNVFDLTAMFGTAIADRAYAMELSTAGSGIAWLKSMGFFTKDYYPYDAGTLKSVEGLTAHRMVGFNQWDEEWEIGGLNYTDPNNYGTPSSTTNQIRAKNYIPALPSTTYYFQCGSSTGFVIAYDNNKTGIASYGIKPSGNTFTTPSNCVYLRFYCIAEYGTNYKNDICINLSDPAKNGTYEPYQKRTYPLDSTLTLRGIPKLDANNQLYYDGDEYASDGTVTRRYGIVDLGTLEWTYVASGSTVAPYFYASYNAIKNNGNPAYYAINAICSKYEIVSRNATNFDDKKICGDGSATVITQIQIKDSAYTDAATFKTAMSGVYLVYELATPTTEEADPFQTPQIVDPYGTEEYETTGIVPVGHSTLYPENLRAKIEGLPFNFATLIAPTETSYKATRAYSTNNLFIVNNILYKATTSIASGGTITPGTNCTATTLAEVIAALS